MSSKREQYNKCIIPYISGSKPKEERKMSFCIGAKICSGKAKGVEEAKRICSLPKEPKPAKMRRSKDGAKYCGKEVYKVAECVVSKLVDSEVYRNQALNINSVGTAVTNALIECQCPKE